MKKKRIYYEGYVTVEASFIFPVVFMVLLLLLYWGFYCYDKSVSVQCSYLAALRGSNEWEMNNVQVEAYVMEQLETLTDQTLLYLKKEEAYVDAGITEIKAAVKGGIEILFSKIRGDDMNRWDVESEEKAYRLKPSSFIRKYHLLEK